MTDRRPLALRLGSALLRMPSPLLDRVIGAPPIEVDSRVLNRQVQAMLHIGSRGVAKASEEHDMAARRAQFVRASSAVMPVRDDIYVTNHRAPGPAGYLALRVYRRTGSVDDSPGIVYLHGGGWAIGNLDSHDAVCRILADESDCVVVAVDYRLAPEHPFPAAVDDAVAAYRWVQQHCEQLSIEPGRVGVMGDSAGGNLAAVIAQVTRDTDVPAPVAQCLVYPSVDAHFTEESHRTLGEGFLLTHDDMVWYREQYLPDRTDWDSPLASPIAAPDLAGTCPALVVTAGFDPLRDEGHRYATRLAEAGTKVRYRCYDDMIHGFFSMGLFSTGISLTVEICRSMGELMYDLA